MKPPGKLYCFHAANLRAINQGLVAVLDSARTTIAQNRPKVIPTYVQLYAFLMGAWTECRLFKLLYEPNAFSETDRKALLEHKALERWIEVVDAAFRLHYSIPVAELRPPALPTTALARRNALRDAIQKDLRYVITLRNKLAHGQWKYPLNDAIDDVAQEQMEALRTENILSLKQKAALVDYVCDSIHDLVVSRPTFERDFDDHFRCVEQIRLNIARKSYDLWVKQIQSRHKRGEAQRRLQLGP